MRLIWRIVSASFDGALFCVRVITDPVQRCCCPGRRSAPAFVFDAGELATALTPEPQTILCSHSLTISSLRNTLLRTGGRELTENLAVPKLDRMLPTADPTESRKTQLCRLALAVAARCFEPA
jgi:hypothetical protein